MTLLKAFLFGATLAIIIGPIALLIINRSLTRGWIHGVRTAIGAALSDFVYAFVAFTLGNSALQLIEVNKNIIHRFSSIVLIGLGLYLIFHAILSYHKKRIVVSRLSPEAEIGSVFVLALTNPLGIVAFVSLTGQITNGITLPQSLVLALAVFLGSLPVQLGIATAAASLHKFFQNPKPIMALNILSGTGIMAFGLSYFV